ncbi:MAG: HupE/UreJ family protein [Gemmatimonadota bacterium]
MSRRNIRLRKAVCAAVLLLLSLGLSGETAAGHEIPPNVAVQAYLKPEGETLRVLVRVPLASMRDMDLPLRGPGFVIVNEADPHLRDAAELWLGGYMAVYENGERLNDYRVAATRISIPSDQSFLSYDQALSHTLSPPISDDIDLIWDQALLDVLLEYPISSETSEFSIEPGLAHLGIRTNTTLRFLPPDGSERVYQYVGDPGLVRLDPRWYQAAMSFVVLGFDHILEGLDHLLFVFCLVIPFRRIRPLIAVVTSFTVAHSITLMAAAFGLTPNALWFPPLIETLIALSIVYMAFENIVGANVQRRWMMAFGFGLVHGFGFSFVLTESLQFAGSHLVTSLLAFNVGVELGQILVVLLTIPVLELIFRKVMAERVGTIILSALVAHTAWHWMVDRGARLLEYDLAWPVSDASSLVLAMRWGMLLLIIIGAGWLMSELFGRLIRTAQPGGSH